jgi:uncharacterized membrane protein HdeD (DUF308 family)
MMTILQILQMISCVLTAFVGVFALVAPQRAANFTGLLAQGGRGITEIRVVLGMFFVALGIFPLIFPSAGAFQMLGFAYLLVGVARVVSIFVDRSSSQSNWISVATEFLFGVILVL